MWSVRWLCSLAGIELRSAWVSAWRPTPPRSAAARRGVGAWLGLLTFRPSRLHRALRSKASGDDDNGRTHAEQGDAEVQDQVPGANLTEGFVGSLVCVMGLELRVPDPTTLSRRGRTVPVRSLPRTGGGPLHLVIDSTARSKDDGCAGIGLLGRLGAPVASSRSGGGAWRHREGMIGVNTLNGMTALGMPESVAVRA